MTLTEAKALIRLLRRHLVMASVTRVLLLTLVTVGFLAGMVQGPVGQRISSLWYAAVLAALAWVLLTVFSVRQVRTAGQASAFISSGRLDLAEEQLKAALRQFTFYRTGKLLALHNLAVVAHGQRNYPAAAELCDGAIAIRRGLSGSVSRICRIVLADCRLLLGDPASARQAIGPLSLDDAALSLSERLMLLPVELRCQVLGRSFQQVVDSLPWKVRLAELLEAPKAALVHTLLAEACRQVGQTEVGEFLARRARLYHDLPDLADGGGLLQSSLPETPIADNNVDIAT